MRSKIRFSRWLLAATVLAVAECTGAASLEIALPAAHAQSSGDLFRSGWARPQSDKLFQNLFASQNWRRQQRNSHRPSSRTSPQHKTKLKPDQNEPTQSRKHKAGTAIATVQNVPLQRPRPPPWPEPHSFAEAAGPDFNTADVTSAPSDCNQRLATIAVIELLPRLIGPGDCGGRDMVRLDAVVLPNHRRVEVNPAAVLRCAMAESFAAWVRDEASAHIATLGAAQRGIETYGSYECRGRNSVSDAKLSEHGKGNAIDVRALILAADRRIELTDETVAKPLREALRDSACHRFTTVLGPGADSYHNNHIHLDILERTHGFRICQWDVREPPPPATKIARAHVKLATTSGLAQPQPRDNQTVTVGPWAIATTYKANKFEGCTMRRSGGELGITFVRTQDGLLVMLDSPKWKLDRGKAYSVRLFAGSRSVDAKALAETQSVTIALADARLNSKLRSASILEVHGEGATLRVPLDGSPAAFERLETCFNRREASGANPLVGRKASETNPFVAPSRKR
ncbi:MAG: extensin family protein [Pseudolabrys sp.]